MGSGAWTPRRRRVRGREGAGGSARQSPAWRAAPSLLFLVQRVISVFGADLRFSPFLVFADSPQPCFALSNFFPPSFRSTNPNIFQTNKEKFARWHRGPDGLALLPGPPALRHLTQLASKSVCAPTSRPGNFHSEYQIPIKSPPRSPSPRAAHYAARVGVPAAAAVRAPPAPGRGRPRRDTCPG